MCVCVCVCVCVIGDCRGPNGFQKGSHNKHEGNQTVEITARSKYQEYAGRFAVRPWSNYTDEK